MNFMEEEEESVLDPSEQTMRPLDVAVQQQRVQAWHPILHPEWMIYTFLAIAVVMIPVGFRLETISSDLIDERIVYDGVKTEDQLCSIGDQYNLNKTCSLEFTAPSDMEPPILIYYELTNFYQNHRDYTSSRDDFQLAGRSSNQDELDAENCSPLNILGDKTLNPCGLVANIFFNDVIRLQPGSSDDNGDDIVMIEEGIAWTSDLEFRFKMPDGFDRKLCEVCDASCCEENEFSCTEPAIDKTDGLCYAYHYPFAEKTQYLYQTYPDIVSPLEHVRNEHFVVWMRIATRPQFRKLYGYIEQTIPAGTKLTFDINANYAVETFGGTKALIISTSNLVGGKNPYLGQTFYYMGFFCLFCGAIFATKHWFRPRKLGDRKYLHYKQE